jgi:predicted nucleic acid-binding protein
LILYLDTSALIKLVLVEPGSEIAVDLWTGAPRAASSILVYPEGRAALAAARRSGRLEGSLYGRTLAKFERTCQQMLWIQVDELVATSAGEGASTFGLRGADAVHLATALELADQEVTFVTWDRDLADAATSAGLPVAGAPV